ncbi:MAG: hypothetical protein NVV59_20770 [Chitinophagaceae bacterium]|nr:hypothetical protein [Chitinophagaceae bacterium]
MSTYYISGIWTNKNDAVTHLNLHEVADGTVSKAKKYTIEQVGKVVESRKFTLQTRIAVNASGNWGKGAPL